MPSQTKPTKIEALTPDQSRALDSYREEWLTIGRSCEPADRPATERTFIAMYTALRKPAPRIWWYDGPAIGSVTRALFNSKDRDNLWDNLGDNLRDNLGDNLGDNLRDNLWDNLGANLRDNLWANLRDNLRANLRVNLWANLWANLGVNLGANLRDNLGDNLRANLGANLRVNLWDNLYWYFWGAHESYWPAYYAWPDSALRPMYTDEQRERLGWWLTLSKSCGWWQPFEHVVFVCERPARQAIDREGRLHHESLPALLCRDGFPVYAWHGVRVPALVIEHPETITADMIAKESNAEVRRVMIERMGWDRWLDAQGAQPVQTDRFGALYRTRLDDADVGVVVVTNSTPEPDGTWKQYALLVPPGHQTAHAAVASTFGLTEAQYQPAQQT